LLNIVKKQYYLCNIFSNLGALLEVISNKRMQKN
jgi:hypothetical protein